MSILRDLRYGARVLVKAPLFTCLAVLVLGLGIGATTAIFSLLDAVLFRPLPFPGSESLVFITEAAPDYAYNRVAPLNFLDWSEQNRSFAAMTAIAGSSHALTGQTAGAEQLHSQSVTVRFFDVFGVRPVAGRTFVSGDATPRSRAVVLSEGFWRRRYGGDPALVGRSISLDGEPYSVIGVAPASFQILDASDLWTVFTPERSPEQRQMHYLRVVARLRAGVSVHQARADMGAIAASIARISPDTNKGWGVTIEPLRDALMGADRATTSVVLGAVVALVLLMAAANVANLLLSRGVTRTRELAVRAALGGRRRDLAQQLLLESLLLGVAGGVTGLAIAGGLLLLAPHVMPPDTLPEGIALTLDARVTLFAAGLTLTTALLFGLLPAWQATSVPLTSAIGASSRSATHRAGRLRGMLVILEVAVAVVLLAGAGLLLRTLASMSHVDAGYHNTNVLSGNLSLPNSRYPTTTAALAFYEAAERELIAIPGVRAVAFSGSLPLDGYDIGQSFWIEGDPAPDAAHMPGAHYQITGARYFDALGITLLRGRAFTSADTATSLPVCIVSESFVRRYARGRDPLALRVSVDAMGPKGPVPVVRQIVGVAPQVKEGPAETDEPVQIYVPLAQNPWFWTNLAVATTVPPANVGPAVRAAIARVDKDEAVRNLRTMDEIAADATARPRFRAELVGLFAGLALMLAAVGVFGVLAFSVHERTRELGLRAALGARSSDLIGMVVHQALRLTAAGVLAGLALSAALTRYLHSLLFGVTPLDPTTFIAAPLVLAATALLAAAAPALRAARVAPAVALRQE